MSAQCQARTYSGGTTWRCRREEGHPGAWVGDREDGPSIRHWVPAHHFVKEEKK